MKDKMLSIRCNDTFLADLNYICKQFNCSQSYIIEILVLLFTDAYAFDDDYVRNKLYKNIVKCLN